MSTFLPSLWCTYLLKSSPLHSLSGPKLGRWLQPPLESRISYDHQLQKCMNAIDLPYWYIRISDITRMACMRILKLEHFIKNVFEALPSKYFLHIDIKARKSICWPRIKIITLFPIRDFSFMHLMFKALDGGKLLVLTVWNSFLPVTVPHVQMLKRATSFSYYPYFVYWWRYS